jgi:hypothetical protein
MADIQTIQGFETQYGACNTVIAIWQAKTKHQLIKYINNASWRKSGDNPGQLYAMTYKAIKYYKINDGFAAVVECSAHYDI